MYGPISDARYSSSWLGLRIIRDHDAINPHGYLKIKKGRTQLLIGDYALPWGTGLLFRRDDFYHQMRSPHTLSAVNSPSRHTLSTVHRRGSVITFSKPNWWTTTAIDFTSTTPEILTGTFLQFQRGTSLGIISSSSNGFTLNFRSKKNSLGLNAEVGLVNDNPSAVLKAVYTPSDHLILFGEVTYPQEFLYGTRLAFTHSFIQAQTSGTDLNLDAQYTLSTSDFSLATRLTTTFTPVHTPSFTARLKASSLTLIAANGSPPSIGLKLSVPHLTLAILTGGSTRLYQFVPTARGSRVQSASTD